MNMKKYSTFILIQFFQMIKLIGKNNHEEMDGERVVFDNQL